MTIIPRGRALGVTQYLPEEDRFNYNQSQILAKLDSVMGGRAAERLVFGELSVGRGRGPQASHPARPVDGHPVRHERARRAGVLPSLRGASRSSAARCAELRDHSEHTAQVIDEEVARILRESDDRAYRLLEKNRDDLERIAEALIEREVLTESELEELVGKRVIDEEDIVERPYTKDAVVASIDNPSMSRSPLPEANRRVRSDRDQPDLAARRLRRSGRGRPCLAAARPPPSSG